MKKRMIALLMAALLVAGSLPVTAADKGTDKTADTTADSKQGQEKNTSGEKNDEKNTTSGITDKSRVKASGGSLNNKAKQKETDKKSTKTTNDKLDAKKTDTKESNKEETFNESEGSKKEQINTTPIAISTLEELQKIGMEEEYPLNGTYELQNDIDAGKLTELPDTNRMPTDEPNNQGETQQENLQKIMWNPIGTKENPFTGVLNGNGHLILNLTIAPAKGDAAFFGYFEGTVKDLAFVNLYAVSKTGNAALFAAGMNKAEMSNVLLNGKAELQNSDGTAYVAVNKKEAANITARKANTATTSTEIQNMEMLNTTTGNAATVNTAGSQNEVLQNQEMGAQSQMQSEQTGVERLKGDIAVEEKDCDYEGVNFIGELQGELPNGVSRIQTKPEYVSIMKGEKETITAPELPFGLQFTAWEVNQETENARIQPANVTLSDMAAVKTELTAESAGKALLKAVYQYGETAVSVDAPVVIGEVINEVEELKPVDDVFYGQLEVVAELVPIDGVFPKWMKEQAPDINGEGENEERIQLYSWEDFKNIGNTGYNPEYTMDGDYILMNDIVSDGLPFTPIGTKENPFTGSFQGQNFMIDVTLNPEIDVSAEYKGLFGVVKPSA